MENKESVVETQESAVKESAVETLAFQAEVKQVLDLMVNSLYANKEVFLRELVSNASDACDKLRFLQLTDANATGDGSALRIRVEYDKELKTITVSDNGIGMSRQEVIENIGTVAHSGTKAFLEHVAQEKKEGTSLIGQFGVGFYSVFIVAKRVDLYTRRFDQTGLGTHWCSTGEASYTLEEVVCAEPGTRIVLQIRDGEEEFLSGWQLRSLIRKYSDHVNLPIEMRKEEWQEEKKITAQLEEWENVNQSTALWTRAKSTITHEEYVEFYKNCMHDQEEPLVYTHNRVEGRMNYTQLFYIPARAPYDLWDQKSNKRGLKLYVQRVFVGDDTEELLPAYLRFVRGIIDCSELSLNVSREVLQNTRDVKQLKDGCTRRVLSLLEDLAQTSPEKYATFWQQFGTVLKEGIVEDHAHCEQIAQLSRFATTKTVGSEQTLSLDEYIARMLEGQEKIYYITAESYTAARHSPHLEFFHKKNIEVILLFERVDEWWLGYFQEYKGKKIQSVSKGDLAQDVWLSDDEKTQQKSVLEDNKALVERLKASLEDRVKDVRISFRLTDSPVCLVVDENDLGGNLQRMLKAIGQATQEYKPIMEINPQHVLISQLKIDDLHFQDWADVFFYQALLAEGGQLEDPANFVKKINELMLMLLMKSQ